MSHEDSDIGSQSGKTMFSQPFFFDLITYAVAPPMISARMTITIIVSGIGYLRLFLGYYAFTFLSALTQRKTTSAIIASTATPPQIAGTTARVAGAVIRVPTV